MIQVAHRQVEGTQIMHLPRRARLPASWALGCLLRERLVAIAATSFLGAKPAAELSIAPGALEPSSVSTQA